MTLEQIAQQAMDYLDSVGVAAEYEIFTDLCSRDDYRISLAEGWKFVRYDLLAVTIGDSIIKLSVLKKTNCTDYELHFNPHKDRHRFYNELVDAAEKVKSPD